MQTKIVLNNNNFNWLTYKFGFDKKNSTLTITNNM